MSSILKTRTGSPCFSHHFDKRWMPNFFAPVAEASRYGMRRNSKIMARLAAPGFFTLLFPPFTDKCPIMG
jgi:hypothetical protein